MADLLLDRWKKTIQPKIQAANNKNAGPQPANSNSSGSGKSTTSTAIAGNKTWYGGTNSSGSNQKATIKPGIPTTGGGVALAGSIGGNGSNKNSQYTTSTLGYDPNANYWAEMEAAVARGDYVAAAKAEQLRNKKIADTGSEYEPTNLYSGWLDNTDYATIGKQQMANGASWQDVLETYTNRYEKAHGTVGLEQYANDEFQNMMLSYINQQKALERSQNMMDEWEEENERPEAPESDPRIDRLLNEILNRDDFSYDATNDPLYQQYAEMYRREGDRAMRETMAEAAAGAGGMNTWAMTAANQANAYYNSQLNDKIPELIQLAYNMYLNDKESKVQDLGILQDMDAIQYSRYRDTMNDWRNDRNFAYGAYRDDVQQGNWQTNFDYNSKWDNINYNNDEYWKNKEWDYNDYWNNKEWDYNDEWRNKEWNYNDEWRNKEWDANQADKDLANSRYDKESAQEEVWKCIALGVPPSAGAIEASGMDSTTVQLLVTAAKAELDAQKKNSFVSESSGGGGSSGGSSGGSGGSKSGGSGGSTSKSSTDSGYTGNKSPAKTPAKTPSTDDYKITNGHGDSWVAVRNMGRVSYQELENMVNKGTVIEVVDEKNKTISYRKA